VEDALQEDAIAHAPACLLDLIDAQGGPGMHRRIHVAERPLIGRDLPVGMHIPLAQDERELLLGEVGIHQRQRHAMKGQIPGGIPGKLPFIGHRDDVGVVEMGPLMVAPLHALRRRPWYHVGQGSPRPGCHRRHRHGRHPSHREMRRQRQTSVGHSCRFP
jgi:hypothetical protein